MSEEKKIIPNNELACYFGINAVTEHEATLTKQLALLRTENERLTSQSTDLALKWKLCEEDYQATKSENERLKAEINTLKAIDSGRNEALTITAKERDQAILKVAELEGALKPFADFYSDNQERLEQLGETRMLTPIELCSAIAPFHCRAARKALEGK